jgi:hypothetical protein
MHSVIDVDEVNFINGNQVFSGIVKRICAINPDAVRYYSRVDERNAILTMLDQGYEAKMLYQMADILQLTHGRPFAPVITTPHEFAVKFSKLAAFVYKEQLTQKDKENNKYAI